MPTTLTKRITEPRAIEVYAKKVMQLRAVLENLTEFVDSLPAPMDEDGTECIPGFDYATLGSFNELHTTLTVASEIADEMYD